MPDPAVQAVAPEGITRRAFIGAGSALGGLMLVACTSDTLTVGPEHNHVHAPGESGYLTGEEMRTVDAITARIVPGDDMDPGARQANVVAYIDAKLASFEGFAEPSYLSGPFVDVIRSGSAAAMPGAIAVAEDQLYRYGYQSGVLPQEMYRRGIPKLDEYSRSRFDSAFADLAEDQQDAILTVLDDIQQASEGQSARGQTGSPSGQQQGGGSQNSGEMDAARAIFADIDAGAFFSTLRADTMEGMFSDPLHRGNEDMAGWILVGYPGIQRAYSPTEMLRGTRRRTQSIESLPEMNTDRGDGIPLEALQRQLPGVREG
ncbi:gluconate 2-dehydrogenase subunit 3 family protein [Salinibacterium sp. SYSU T00001]|uniref:gluconate 2-dehydrogenase subunit 3 family protein n=1 Tax=Homoserinimonas sedimenticola TaxID=2986805 RepID=UPI0022365403|nr:gluconate 2-dehydrogenase subunit 3 family protein [Salinibacterium sedimenticola]MCW4384787.1 gluconate 2-dehydrogenase subunit 3 family protein [Salinibacterium sedimenticola]